MLSRVGGARPSTPEHSRPQPSDADSLRASWLWKNSAVTDDQLVQLSGTPSSKKLDLVSITVSFRTYLCSKYNS